MASVCSGDPVICIDFAVLLVGEFLKDWTTLAMMAVLLVLLVRLRRDRQERAEAEYTRQLAITEQNRRREEERGSTWATPDDSESTTRTTGRSEAS